MQGVIQQLRQLSSAEDFLRFFGIVFDEKVVNVSRLHIMRRFLQYIEQEKELPPDDATAALSIYRSLLQNAYNDFVVSTPAEQKVFKVFQEAAGRHVVSLENLRASLPARDGV
ncbi:nitrogenase stabilizing/protective protein NifW [Paraburkholderia azotifigens]|uniref:Nitrogenase-stabilizing/protective protein NifW n=1 Tax=Paraburkholderia azotifigens TaxID=2057004 RepID=A0ABU9RG77_9BURK